MNTINVRIKAVLASVFAFIAIATWATESTPAPLTIVEGKATLDKPEGDAAFFRVVVDFKPFTTSAQ